MIAQPRGGSDKTECTAGERCQCPCYTSTDYSYCSGHFTITESVGLLHGCYIYSSGYRTSHGC